MNDFNVGSNQNWIKWFGYPFDQVTKEFKRIFSSQYARPEKISKLQMLIDYCEKRQHDKTELGFVLIKDCYYPVTKQAI